MTERVTHRISAEGADPLALAGVNDANLLALEQATGAQASLRGDQVTLAGPLSAVERASAVAARMVDAVRVDGALTPDDVSRLAANGCRRLSTREFLSR